MILEYCAIYGICGDDAGKVTENKIQKSNNIKLLHINHLIYIYAQYAFV